MIVADVLPVDNTLTLPVAYGGHFHQSGGWALRDWSGGYWFVRGDMSVQSLHDSDTPHLHLAALALPLDAANTQALLLRVQDVVGCTEAHARQWQ